MRTVGRKEGKRRAISRGMERYGWARACERRPEREADAGKWVMQGLMEACWTLDGSRDESVEMDLLVAPLKADDTRPW
jgi:hypothetical protein